MVLNKEQKTKVVTGKNKKRKEKGKSNKLKKKGVGYHQYEIVKNKSKRREGVVKCHTIG